MGRRDQQSNLGLERAKARKAKGKQERADELAATAAKMNVSPQALLADRYRQAQTIRDRIPETTVTVTSRAQRHAENMDRFKHF